GHMAKTRREIKENLKLVDAVIEIRDARIPRSSANPEVDELCGTKPRIILLNKADLAESKVTDMWVKHLTNSNIKVIPCNSMTGAGLRNIRPLLNELLAEKHERKSAKGIVNIVDRVMVIGIPNVGKSSFINKMAKNAIAKTGDKPGVTRSRQWIKTKLGIELMDTPGILWPKLESDETQFNLAFTGAIKDEIMDIDELSVKLVDVLAKNYPEKLMSRYKLTSLSEDPAENLEMIGRKRGAVMSGGRIDYNRIAVLLLDELRGGKLGNISFERPESDE
ncbi:MAG TPA: ribosome biogenesis GTPase YlqF, partial [Clostridiaceae bacterium]